MPLYKSLHLTRLSTDLRMRITRSKWLIQGKNYVRPPIRSLSIQSSRIYIRKSRYTGKPYLYLECKKKHYGLQRIDIRIAYTKKGIFSWWRLHSISTRIDGSLDTIFTI